MTQSAPLILTAEVRDSLHALRDKAATMPVDVRRLRDDIKTTRGEREHRERMTTLSLVIPGPWPFTVVFSIEVGHPVGPCRHMSMAIDRQGRVPNPAGVYMVAEELGFVGGLDACSVWIEELRNRGKAVNLVQPLSATTRQ